MVTSGLNDILINARQESIRMQHYYLGIEHIMVAMLEMRDGLTSSLIADSGFSPDYVIDRIRQKIGKASRNRPWAGIPNSPRMEVVLGIIDDMLKDREEKHFTERDMLLAILEEGDSIPLRVLKAIGIDPQKLYEQAKSRQASPIIQPSFLNVDFATDFGESLDKDQLFILRRMFYGYSKIRIETRLPSGYTPATVIVVTPVRADERADASVVVKIGYKDNIQEEYNRYERVKSTLPPLTARLEGITTENTSELSALKYTFITNDEGNPQDMRAVIHKWQADKLAEWLNRLFETFGTNWWQQKRPYRFEAWQEYDWVLPPVLTLEFVDFEKSPEDSHKLRFPIKRNRLENLEYGDYVTVENFIVHKVDKEQKTLTLALGQGGNTTRPFQIEIRGVPLDRETFYSNEVVQTIVGRIWKTRHEELRAHASNLEPEFDHSQKTFTIGNYTLPNPIFNHSTLLGKIVLGSLSTIHGDLHLGNILVGANESPLLIDFGLTREGHTLFDWANLEISLLNHLLEPHLATTWETVYRMLPYLLQLNTPTATFSGDPAIIERFKPLHVLRQIAGQMLHQEGRWEEYYIALALLALRAVTWKTMSRQAHRLMFLVSALATQEASKQAQRAEDETVSPDDTEFPRNTA